MLNLLYEPVVLSEMDLLTVGTGWLPPLPDLRDYNENHPKIIDLTHELGLTKQNLDLPSQVNLKKYFSPIENQGPLGSCTAHAGVGLVEYFERRAFRKHLNASRCFLYKTTRNLLGWTGDTGAWLRTTMGALAVCGVPPEKYWPYNIQDFDDEPTAFAYALADNFEALRYFCHDPISRNKSPAEVLHSVKKWLAAGIPAMFGFYGFPSFNHSDEPGHIPYPCSGEQAIWGHAIVAAGYDDTRRISNTECNETTVGALLIRNSWGTGWGQNGYGWLPYDYIRDRLATDFWSLLRMGWVNTKKFGF
jgi:C1A family cysteine protease